MIATLLSASVGVPYVVSQQSAEKTSAEATQPATAQPSGISTPAPHLPVLPAAATPNAGLPAGTVSTPSSAARMHPVEQVLRFDLTRDWIYQNWDRKTTAPTDVGLYAVRVTLVSGTDISSLAGSLTYFLNSQDVIEHISFRGRTGDARRLIAFMVRTYLFEPVVAPAGEELYQVKRSGKVHSELRVRPEPVIRSTTPHGNVAVELELGRPGTNRFLPPRGINLQLPPVGTPTATSTAGASNGDDSHETSSSAVEAFFDKARYASPEEQGQVLWKRWPN
jgi:hypothetical protein